MNLNGKVEFFLVKRKLDLCDTDLLELLGQFSVSDILEIRVKKYRKKRSNKMNAYMWSELIPKFMFALRERGYRMDPLKTESFVIELLKNMTPKGTHEYLKSRFAKKVVVDEDTGEVVDLDPSTRDMTVDEMQEYWAEAIQVAAEEFGIQILLPREFDFQEIK